jgi:hypothetical protein
VTKNLVLLTSRKSYEFPPDGIRLTVLTLPEVRSKITFEFGFEFAGIGTPLATFDQPAQTHPPGIAFDVGSIAVSGETYAIRFLHVEARRIVIDVAAPSAVIEAVYERFRAAVADYHAPDGQPAVGSHDRVLDYSEFSASYGFGTSAFLNPRLMKVLEDAASATNENEHILVPSIYLFPQSVQEASVGAVSQPLSNMFQFSVRAGTRPLDRVYFSGAPLDSDSHRSMLESMDSRLTSDN